MARVLVVEDSPTQARRLQGILARDGFDVAWAKDAEQGLALLEAEGFDIIVTDLQMPGMSGLDLCRAVRAHPRLRAVPVLLVTAATDPAIALDGLAAGADGFMTKQHGAGAIIARVRRVLAAGARAKDPGPASRAEFLGRTYEVAAGREHLLDFLVSAFEDVTVLEEERRRATEARLKLEELERVQQMRARLINIAAHELGTPLTPMRVEVRLLGKGGLGPLNPRQARAVQLLERNIARLDHLVKEVLDVATLQAGGLVLHPSTFDLAALVRDTAARFGPGAAEKGVALEAGAPDLLPLRADLPRVTQVLANLVDNALRFTPPGGRVRIEAHAEGAEARVEVADTGAGLSAAQMASLFQPFGHGHDPMQDARPASGLGLFIGKGIVELHGGRMWCASPGPGRGATFGFALPLAPAAEAAEPRAE